MIPMTDPTPSRSAAAQAVLDAVVDGALPPFHVIARPMAAAAIRALVEQTVPEEPYCHEDDPMIEYTLRSQRQLIRLNQLAIAAELEQEAQK
jgi:hypothetical protein